MSATGTPTNPSRARLGSLAAPHVALFGRTLAEEFAHNGYDLVLVARREEELKDAAAEFAQYGVTANVVPADLGSRETREALYEKVVEDAVSRETRLSTTSSSARRASTPTSPSTATSCRSS